MRYCYQRHCFNSRQGFKLINACIEKNIPHNVVICYGKAESQMRIIDTHKYIRILVFPRKPVTGE